MTLEYVHQKLGEEVTALAGFYAPLKELRLKHNEREVLSIVGMCSVESSCCGNRSFKYAIVPGYIVTQKKNKAGQQISEVDSIADETTRREIAKIIREIEGILSTNIEFW